jgi:hypothetical protein
MLTKIYRSALLFMLLWLLGGTRPVRAKLKREFNSSEPLKPAKRQCFSDLSSQQLSSQDLSDLVAASTHVFEATVISRSQPDPNFAFGVNLRLKKSFKGDLNVNGKNLDYVRMSFHSSLPEKEVFESGECPVLAVLEPGKKYLVFSREIRNRQFVPLIAPVPRTKAFIKEMKKYICHKCGELKSQIFQYNLKYLYLLLIE